MSPSPARASGVGVRSLSIRVGDARMTVVLPFRGSAAQAVGPLSLFSGARPESAVAGRRPGLARVQTESDGEKCGSERPGRAPRRRPLALNEV